MWVRENSNTQISTSLLFNKRARSFYRSHLTRARRLSFTNVHTILIVDEAVQERGRNSKNPGCPATVAGRVYLAITAAIFKERSDRRWWRPR